MSWLDTLLNFLAEREAEGATPEERPTPPPVPEGTPLRNAGEEASISPDTRLVVPSETRREEDQPVRYLPREDGSPGFTFRVDPATGRAVRYVHPDHPQLVRPGGEFRHIMRTDQPAPTSSYDPSTAPQSYSLSPTDLAVIEMGSDSPAPTGRPDPTSFRAAEQTLDPVVREILMRQHLEGMTNQPAPQPTPAPADADAEEEGRRMMETMLALAQQREARNAPQ